MLTISKQSAPYNQSWSSSHLEVKSYAITIKIIFFQLLKIVYYIKGCTYQNYKTINPVMYDQ